MSKLVGPFQDLEVAQLRIVATLGSLDYEIEFIRDDIAEAYSEKDLEEAYRNLVANQVSADDFRQSVGFNDLNFQTFFFDETVVFLFPSSRYDSVFISFDYEYPFPLRTVIDAASTIPALSPPDQR